MPRMKFTIEGEYEVAELWPDVAGAVAHDQELFSMVPERALVAADELCVTVRPVEPPVGACVSCDGPLPGWGSPTVCDMCEAMETSSWIGSLRELGVKAAHPDNVWVDQDECTVILACAYFDDGLTIGDMLAIGRPLHPMRFVRVIGEQPASWYRGRSVWTFEEVER